MTLPRDGPGGRVRPWKGDDFDLLCLPPMTSPGADFEELPF